MRTENIEVKITIPIPYDKPIKTVMFIQKKQSKMRLVIYIRIFLLFLEMNLK